MSNKLFDKNNNRTISTKLLQRRASPRRASPRQVSIARPASTATIQQLPITSDTHKFNYLKRIIQQHFINNHKFKSLLTQNHDLDELINNFIKENREIFYVPDWFEQVEENFANYLDKKVSDGGKKSKKYKKSKKHHKRKSRRKRR